MILPENWQPVGLDEVEANANTAIRSEQDILVIAGPGAGKTELLAQKACYLLQTNICQHPKKILAISFKRDSAKNLKERVALRCGDDLSRRFDSFTFEGFAKSILDRFRNGLPREFLPSASYDIGFDHNQLFSLLQQLPYQGRPGNEPLVNLFNAPAWQKRRNMDGFQKNYLTNFQLGDEERNREYIFTWAADRVWELLIEGDPNTGKSKLSFQMISRLAEYIVSRNVFIKKSLLNTYSHVFLDEFQDTTTIQYEFLKTCFFNSQAKISAVGDGKQRIMLWAGARASVFEDFKRDFNAEEIQLNMNYRCAPRLIELQTLVARSLNPRETAQVSPDDEGGIIKRIDFNNPEHEAQVITRKIQNLINEEGIEPNEICFLFKQQVDINASSLIATLSNVGIKSRNEEVFQDLLKEDLVHVFISYLKYIFNIERSAWNNCVEVLVGGYAEVRLTRELELSLRRLKEVLNPQEDHFFQSLENLNSLLLEICQFIGNERILSLGGQYNQDHIGWVCEKFADQLFNIYDGDNTLLESLTEFEGENVIPCMTIHKSKGLEFEVVFLIGLEDGLFWSYRDEPQETTQAFFVAISRPINQLYITYSQSRSGSSQARDTISPLYVLLDEGDVEHVDLTAS